MNNDSWVGVLGNERAERSVNDVRIQQEFNRIKEGYSDSGVGVLGDDGSRTEFDRQLQQKFNPSSKTQLYEPRRGPARKSH
jgi:hypothetical protein